jgi:thioesterase domain-containing protein
VHAVPGDHHTMLREPNVRILAEKLKEYLRRAESCQ